MITKSPPPDEAQILMAGGGGSGSSSCGDHDYEYEHDDDQLHKCSLMFHVAEQKDDEKVGPSRVVSKETAAGSSVTSFRVYYAESCGSVPFTWESRPGTPKYAAAARFSPLIIPPLTPPPSFQYSHYSLSTTKKIKHRRIITSKLVPALFMRIHLKKPPPHLFPPPSSPLSSSAARCSSSDHDITPHHQTTSKSNTGIASTLRAAGLCFGSTREIRTTATSVVTFKRTLLSSILARRGSDS